MTEPRPDPMPDPLRVRPGEAGVVRLFALEMPPEQARFLRDGAAAAQALGVEALDPAQVEVFPVADLDGLGLEGYLAEGFGIDAARLAPDRDRLRALSGWVMVVRSRAFAGKGAQLHPAPGIRPLGAYAEPGVDWSGGHIETASARAGSGPPASRRTPPRQARARARAIGASIFTGVMIAIVALVTWLLA